MTSLLLDMKVSPRRPSLGRADENAMLADTVQAGDPPNEKASFWSRLFNRFIEALGNDPNPDLYY